MYEVPPTAGLPLAWSDFSFPNHKPQFEQKLCHFLDTDFAQLECSGTAALVIALSALKELSPRRQVIIPAYTCPLIPIAVHQAGLDVAICDTVANSFDLAPNNLATLCNNKTLCVVPNYLGGLIGNLSTVSDIAKNVGAFVIENAAQALGATWRGRAAGTTGDIGILSFTRGKGLTIWEGGLLTAHDPAIINALKRTSSNLSTTDLYREFISCIQLYGYRLFYNPTALSFFYGLPRKYFLSRGDVIKALDEEFSFPVPIYKVSNWRASVGESTLERLPVFLNSSRQRALSRVAQLRGIPGLHILEETLDVTGSWPFLMLVFDQVESCQQVLANLWSSELGVTRLFTNDLTNYPYLKGIIPIPSVPNAASFAERMLTVSNSPWLDDGRFQKIIHTIRSCV